MTLWNNWWLFGSRRPGSAGAEPGGEGRTLDVTQAWRPQQSEPTQQHVTHALGEKRFGLSTARILSICHPLSPAAHTLPGRGAGFPWPPCPCVGEPAECSVQPPHSHRPVELYSKRISRQSAGWFSKHPVLAGVEAIEVHCGLFFPQQVLSMIINAAYKPGRVLKELQLVEDPHWNFQEETLKAK